jgi:hypothetical protein
MSRRVTLEMLNQTSKVGIDFVWWYVRILLAVGLFVSIATAAAAMAWFNASFLSVLTLMGMALGLVLLFFILSSSHKVSTWISDEIAEIIAWSKQERGETSLPDNLPAALPAALPVENRQIPVTSGGRVGVVSLNPPVHGFIESDLFYVCELIGGGYKFTEEYMEKVLLPSSRLPMGKAEEGTPYKKLFDSERGLFVRAGIIEGRKPKYSGKLVVTDPAEMMLLIKALPEDTPTP